MPSSFPSNAELPELLVARLNRVPSEYRVKQSSSRRRGLAARCVDHRESLVIAICLFSLLASGVFGHVLLQSPSAAAADEASVSISPSTDLSSGQTITATVVNTLGTSWGYMRVRICGNVTRSGDPIETLDETRHCNSRYLSNSGYLSSYSTAVLPGNALTANRTYTAELTAGRTGFGSEGASCVPRSTKITRDCVVWATGDRYDLLTTKWSSAYSVTATFRMSTPTVAISDITNAGAGKKAARAGSVITLDGTKWDFVNTPLTAELCDQDGTKCQSAGSLNLAASGGGFANGANSVTVPAIATLGDRWLFVRNSFIQVASVPIRILGARSITATPNSVVRGQTVIVNGFGFTPNSSVRVQQATVSALVGLSVASTANDLGEFIVSIVVGDASTTHLRGFEVTGNSVQPVSGTEVSLPFVPIETACRSDRCERSQNFRLSVASGPLTMSQVSNDIRLSDVVETGTELSTSGSIKQIRIDDARGTRAGWSVSLTMSELRGAAGQRTDTLAPSNVTLTPRCGSAQTSLARAGTAGKLDTSSPLVLCSLPIGSVSVPVTIDADFTVKIPGWLRSGTYSGSILVVVT